MDAKEARGIALINIPTAFIQTLIDHDKVTAIINFCGTLVEMLLYISPDVYVMYVTTDSK